MAKHQFNDETMSVKLCKECKGVGYYPSDTGWTKCPVCNGTGRVVIEKHDLEFSFGDFEFLDDQMEMPFDDR